MAITYLAPSEHVAVGDVFAVHDIYYTKDPSLDDKCRMFYQVIEINGMKVTLQAIGAEHVDSNGNWSMGEKRPVPNSFLDEDNPLIDDDEDDDQFITGKIHSHYHHRQKRGAFVRIRLIKNKRYAYLLKSDDSGEYKPYTTACLSA